MKIKNTILAIVAAVGLSGCGAVTMPLVAGHWVGAMSLIPPEEQVCPATTIEANWAGLCGDDGICFDPDRPSA